MDCLSDWREGALCGGACLASAWGAGGAGDRFVDAVWGMDKVFSEGKRPVGAACQGIGGIAGVCAQYAHAYFCIAGAVGKVVKVEENSDGECAVSKGGIKNPSPQRVGGWKSRCVCLQLCGANHISGGKGAWIADSAWAD